jgi:phytoene synthase
VYAFARRADDIGDGDLPTTRKLEELRAQDAALAAVAQGAPEPGDPVATALDDARRRFPLPLEALGELVEGVRMDVDGRRYETFEQLVPYCRRVAGAVGRVCLAIFGLRERYRGELDRAYGLADDLGVALQLTNILRDVPGDLDRGRVYIPLEDFARFGCHEGDLGAEAIHAGHGVRSPAVKQLLAFQAQRARDYYRRADAMLPRRDARRLVSARIMGAIYRGILGRIEAKDYDVFSEVIRVPRPRRALIAATTWARTAITGR